MYFFGHEQREGIGLSEYQVMPSLRDVAHGSVLCTFMNRSASDWDKWCGSSGLASTVQLITEQMLGESPPASQAGRHVGPVP